MRVAVDRLQRMRVQCPVALEEVRFDVTVATPNRNIYEDTDGANGGTGGSDAAENDGVGGSNDVKGSCGVFGWRTVDALQLKAVFHVRLTHLCALNLFRR